MLRHAGIECVFAERIGAADQAKTRYRHDQVPETAHAADRTVAVECVDRGRGIDLETHTAAMAAAVMRQHRCRCGCVAHPHSLASVFLAVALAFVAAVTFSGVARRLALAARLAGGRRRVLVTAAA